MSRRPRTRGQKLRRALFLASVGAAALRFALARRPKKDLTAPRAPEWPPLAPITDTPAEKPAAASEPAGAEDSDDDSDDDPDRAGAAWVAPVDGACPLTHPIKGNVSRGIFHAPGGQFYAGTNPERCYRDVDAAQADGLRASKR